MGKRGPKQQYPEHLHLRVNQAFIDAVDSLRQPDETRSDAIRRLIKAKAINL